MSGICGCCSGRGAQCEKNFFAMGSDPIVSTEEFHGKSRRNKGAEDSVDIGLTYFSYVCYLYQTNILRDEDFELFKYTIDRAVVNRGVQDYFYNLYHFSTRQGIPFPFPALLKYAEQNGLLTNGFFSIKSSDSEGGCFHRFLNF